MKPNWSNVFIISLGLVLAATTVFALYLAHNQPIIPQKEKVEESWLPIPTGGMDASNIPVRELLRNSSNFYMGTPKLADVCDSSNEKYLVNEEYRIRTTAAVWSSPALILRIIFTGEDAILYSQLDGIPPPLPGSIEPERLKRLRYNFEKQNQFHLMRNDLDDVKTVLLRDGIWLGDQTMNPFGCYDGNAIRIQACINGKYFERWRDCEISGADEIFKIGTLRFTDTKSDTVAKYNLLLKQFLSQPN